MDRFNNLNRIKEIAKRLHATRLDGETLGDYLTNINTIYNDTILTVDYITITEDKGNVTGAVNRVTYADGSKEYYYWINRFAEKEL